MHKPFGKLCLYGFGRTPSLIVIMIQMERQLLLIELNGKLLLFAMEINV